MKLLTKHTDYAIRALVYLARRPDAFVSAREIAEEQIVPYPFLRRILQSLIQAKLVVSQGGVCGGVKMARAPGKIRVVDIIDLFQGEVQLMDCMMRSKACPHRPTCPLRGEVSKIEALVEKEFGKITIAKLIAKRHEAT